MDITSNLTIGISGSSGLLGWHANCLLATMPNVRIVTANRETFASASSLDRFANNADAVFHFAGMNRGEDDEIERVNPTLAAELVAAMRRTGSKPHLIHSSSTHVDKDSPYGRSKRAAGVILAEWADAEGATFTNLILPHVFGEFGRPFHNSVVATFCYQLANDARPEIISDSTLELVHAGRVARKLLKILDKRESGEIRMQGHEITVSDLSGLLGRFDRQYRGGLIPELGEPIELELFNTYRSFLFPHYYPGVFEQHADDRGTLFEAVKRNGSGQTFFSITRPGITRGNHFHFSKIERFLVLSGQAKIRIRRLLHDECWEFDVRGDKPAYVDMPTLCTHNITNTGDDELLTMFWSSEIFDPEFPDTHACEV